jgi:hypothetical protein
MERLCQLSAEVIHMENPNPSGAQMLAKQWIVREKMEKMLNKNSPTRFRAGTGWHFIAELEYYARHEPHTAQAVSAYLNHRLYKAGTPMPAWVFKRLGGGTEPETVRRRVQEIQKPERDAVDKGILDIENAIYLPSKRVLDKRERLRFAMECEFGSGQQTVSDFMEG